MKWLHLAIGISWLAFWLYWFAAAANTKQNIHSLRRGRGLRAILFLPMVVAIYLTIHRRNDIGWQISVNQSWVKIIGVILLYGGFSVAIWARHYLGSNWGVPMAVKKDPQLVTGGPYAVIRHPIYSGLILAVLGTLLVNSITWLVVLVVTIVYFTYSALEEDKIMAKQFPKTYPDYKRRTKMLIPYIF